MLLQVPSSWKNRPRGNRWNVPSAERQSPRQGQNNTWESGDPLRGSSRRMAALRITALHCRSCRIGQQGGRGPLGRWDLGPYTSAERRKGGASPKVARRAARATADGNHPCSEDTRTGATSLQSPCWCAICLGRSVVSEVLSNACISRFVGGWSNARCVNLLKATGRKAAGRHPCARPSAPCQAA